MAQLTTKQINEVLTNATTVFKGGDQLTIKELRTAYNAVHNSIADQSIGPMFLTVNKQQLESLKDDTQHYGTWEVEPMPSEMFPQGIVGMMTGFYIRLDDNTVTPSISV